MSISLYDILTYIEVGSRPLIEGEAVLNANHIIMCGTNAENSKEIIALCQQSSQWKGPPHCLNIFINSSLPQEWKCVCTCKAGAGGKCKHIIACLLFINRNKLEVLSCTDLEQAWGKRKLSLSTTCIKEIVEFCHVKKLNILTWKTVI